MWWLKRRLDGKSRASRDALDNNAQPVKGDESKQSQKLHNKQERVLEDLLDELKRTQQKLVDAEKMATLGRLVPGVAHEINTPVGISVTAASNLAERVRVLEQRLSSDQVTRDELERFLLLVAKSSEIMLSNLSRAGEMVRSFKEVATDQSSQAKRCFRVLPYLEDIKLSLYPRIKKAPHQLVVECPEELELHSFPGFISQIITNLVVNSLVHGFDEQSNKKGVMKIEVQPLVPTGIRMVYSDNGKGISKSNIEKLFEPFFTTNREGGGTGLGLHVIHNLVTQSLQGDIKVSSSEGQGVKFTIDIPEVE